MNTWFLRHFPRIWQRWWAARILATAACAKWWLSPNNPEFNRWQRSKRTLFGMLIFLWPEKLPISISTKTQ